MSRRKLLVMAMVVLVSAVLLAQGGSDTLRVLTGRVSNQADAPVTNATVYLKNMKTLAITTVFTDQNGNYRFPALSRTTDYEVYAQVDNKRSDRKTLSSLDSRTTAVVNLRVATGK